MRALKDGGVLSVTLWNKEEPPKSVLKLYTTMAAAARDVDGGDIADRFFVVVELSLDRDRALQARRLHRRGDRQAARSTRARCRSTKSTIRASTTTTTQTAEVLEGYRHQIFFEGAAANPSDRRRSDDAGRDTAAAATTRRRRRSRSGAGESPARRCPRRPWANWPGTARPRRLGRHRRALRLRHPSAHQQRGPTSPPT